MKKNILVSCLILCTYISATGQNSVGAMGGVFNVSPMGGATYSIPIEVPLGVGGLQPQIAITYNSQSGSGLCGYGATISGVSVITRGPKNLFIDGTTLGMSYLANDALYLDGTRLILESGVPGQENATYVLESDPFTKVITHGTSTSYVNNTWFELQKSDGTIVWYGCGETSRQSYYDNYGRQKIHSWYVDVVLTPTGNNINYIYDTVDNCVYLICICYGSNLNNQGQLSNMVSFSYETSNGIPLHFDEKQGSLSKRLKTITSTTNDSIYRTYSFTYDNSSDGTKYKYSRLTEVAVTNGAGDALPSTLFNWEYLPSLSYQSTNLSVSTPSTPGNLSLPFGDQIYVAGDLNNDGLDDIAGLTAEVSVGGQIKSYLNIYWAQRSSNGVIYPTGTLFEMPDLFNNKRFIDREKGDFHSFFNGSAIVDWDGNGYNEVLLPYYQTVSGQKNMKFLIQGCNSTGQSCWNQSVSCPLNSSDGTIYSTGDLNNDGRQDIMIIEKAKYSGAYMCHLLSYDPSLSNYLRIVNMQLSLPSAPRQIYLSDMNGNGVLDLFVICKDNYVVYWNQGGSTINTSMFSDSFKRTGTDLKKNNMTTSGDFNGDGLLDILTNESGSSNWNLNINNGDGTFLHIVSCSLDAYEQYFTDRDNDKFHCDVFDFDGDGKSDVVVTKAKYDKKSDWSGSWGIFNKTHTYWLRSDGMGLEQVYHATSNNANDALTNRYVVGDYNGDGLRELATFGYDCVNGTNSSTSPSWRLLKHNGYTLQTGKVISIVGDYGSTINITYSSLTDPSVYSMSTTNTYPAPIYTIPLNVVSSVTQSNGASGNNTTSYLYSDLKVHIAGKGLLGFRSMQTNNNVLGITTTTEIISWNSTYYQPNSTRVITNIGGSTSQSFNSISYVNKGGKKYFSYPSQTINIDFDNNTITTNLDYNTEKGYLTRERVDYGPYMYRMTEYQNYTNNKVGGAYRPQRIVTTQLHEDDYSHPFSQVTEYSYDSRGLVIQTVSNAQAPNLKLTTNSTYDVWGNLTSQVSSGTGVSQCTTYYTYDATHRFPVRVYTNPSSSVNKYTYDLFGNVLTERDSINTSIDNTVTHTYDGWGNRIRSEIPGSGVTTVTSGWGSDGSMCYYILEQGTASPWVKTWYDSKGRVVKTESVGAHDVSLIGTVSYDSKGLKIAETETTGSLTLSHSYSYDARGRLVSETHPGSNTITYSYFKDNNGNNKTVNDNGRATTYTYDAMGNLTAVVSPGYSTLWNWYYSNGNISSAESDGATWEFDYDACGNRTSMTDPDAGTSYYVYDALGREIERIDARGVVFVTDYDYLGRVTSMTAGNETTTYTYGTSGTGQMRLSSESNGQWTKSYVYDGLGRVTQETIRNNGLNYTRSMSYHYDANSGLLTRQDYPGSKSVEYSYDVYGNCTSVNAQNGELVWSLTGNTGNSTVSAVTLGNTTPYSRTTQMDNIGSLQSRVMTRGSQTIQNDSYLFDPLTGNLLSRTLTGHPVETFTYDNLDRLTCIESPGQTDIDISYYVDGSIAAKSDFGSYTYRTDKRHAVDNIDLLNGTSVRDQYIYYNDWNMMEYIEYADADNDNYDYDVEYGPDRERVMSWLYVNYDLYCRKFYWGDYEECEYSNGEIVRNYWIGGGDGLAGLLRTSTTGNTAQTSAYVAMTDHLGSLTGLYDGSGNQTFGASYDAWGKRTVTAGSLEIERGFTGHEHLDFFGLINMNGRMYDPIQGRFLSPDPFVQAPQNPQNYNRYSYCLNNPLKYTDPSGEIFGLLLGFTSDLYNNLKRTFRGEKWDWSRTKMGWKIDQGLFMTDPNKSTGERIWEFISRITRQLPQTITGDLYVSALNAAGKVNDVTYGYGVTAVDAGLKEGAVTIGYFSAGPKGYKADWRDHLFVHEYGHYLQSQDFGGLYLPLIGIPSLQSAIIDTKKNNAPEHGKRWFETGANRRAGEYFDKYCGSGRADYDPESDKFFDIKSFRYGEKSKYINPRTGDYNQKKRPFTPNIHWTDIVIMIPILGCFPYFIYK